MLPFNLLYNLKDQQEEAVKITKKDVEEVISIGRLTPYEITLDKNSKAEEPAPEPTVKICPFCYSEINYKASRCPHCTSVLETEKK